LSKGEVKVDLASAFESTEEVNTKIAIDASNKKVIRISIHGGVVEMLNDKVIVLAE